MSFPWCQRCDTSVLGWESEQEVQGEITEETTVVSASGQKCVCGGGCLLLSCSCHNAITLGFSAGRDFKGQDASLNLAQ
jgi:hypothetical protein